MSDYQHVVYLTSDGHVHELYYPLGATGPRWATTDVIADTGAPAAVAGSALTSWADAHYQHVVYLTSDGHVHELYYPLGATGPRWATTDVIADTGAPAAVAGSALTSWADAHYQHVVYLTSDGHVHELYYPLGATGPRWATTDVIADTGAPAAVAGSALTSWADAHYQHVVYLTSDGHVHELYYPLGATGPRWATTDVIADTGAPAAVAGSALTSWADAHYQHVVYLTSDGHVHELYYPLGATGPRWATTDVIADTGAPAAVAGSALTSWADAHYQHVVYLTSDGHVHELYYPLGATGPRWATTDVIADTGAPAAVAGSALTSWADAHYQHVVYLTSDGHVHELYYPLGATGPRWATTDVIADTGAPAAVAGSALTSWADPSRVVPPPPGDLTVTPASIIYKHSLDLGADTGNIAGPISLTITSDGSYNFSGQLNNSGKLPYTVNVAVGIESAKGSLFLFTASQSIKGNDLIDNNNASWDTTGNNATIKGVWDDLQAQTTPNYQSSNSLDLSAIVSSLQSAFQDVQNVITVAAAL